MNRDTVKAVDQAHKAVSEMILDAMIGEDLSPIGRIQMASRAKLIVTRVQEIRAYHTNTLAIQRSTKITGETVMSAIKMGRIHWKDKVYFLKTVRGHLEAVLAHLRKQEGPING